MSRGLLAAWAVCIASCGFHPANGSLDASQPSPIDAPPDARPLPDAPACHSTCAGSNTLTDCTTGQPVTCPLGCHMDPIDGDRCGEPVPSNGATTADLGPQDLVIDAATTMDSTTGEIRVDATNVDLRSAGTGLSPEGYRYTVLGTDRGVLGVHSLTITNTGTLKIAGTLVPIILSAGDITIEGTLDVSGGVVACGASPLEQCAGAGAGMGGNANSNGTGCSPGAGGTSSNGGGGGGYGSPAGGNGGGGGGNGGAGNCSTQTLVPIVGGSGGGGGGNGGVGGGGGGAIQLTALGNLEVHTTGGTSASVRANGAGGQAGTSSNGGGGAGSSGGILLEGQRVIIDGAILVANGGGGGAGNGGTDGSPGTLTDNGASGGTGGDPGGGGASRSASPQSGSSGGSGTGGGGGGIGRIFINSGAGQYTLLNSYVVSPVEYNATATAM